MVMRVKVVHRLRAKRLIRVRGRLAVVDEHRIDLLRSVPCVADEAVGGVGVVARLPDVVGRGARDDERGALELQECGGVGEVAGVG